MYSTGDQAVTLYDALAEAVPTDLDGPHEPPPPDTVLTATVETIDNDRAYSLLDTVNRI